MSVSVLWDEQKRALNLAKHGIDFVAAAEVFDGRFCLEKEDTRQDYGERRYNRLSEVNGIILHITYTRRDGSYRLISARSANAKERKAYVQRKAD